MKRMMLGNVLCVRINMTFKCCGFKICLYGHNKKLSAKTSKFPFWVWSINDGLAISNNLTKFWHVNEVKICVYSLLWKSRRWPISSEENRNLDVDAKHKGKIKVRLHSTTNTTFYSSTISCSFYSFNSITTRVIWRGHMIYKIMCKGHPFF